MLTEDDVIDAVRDFLVREGWAITARATVRQRGTDLVAERNGDILEIEAKGAGSSRVGSARYGEEFNSGQVFDHVAKAILKALRVLHQGGARAAIALPDNAHHRSQINQVAQPLADLSLAVYWVDESKAVRVENEPE